MPMKNSFKRLIIIFGSWKIALFLLLFSILIKISINFYEDKLFQIKNDHLSEVLRKKIDKLIEFKNFAEESAQKLYKEIDIEAFTNGKFPNSDLFGNILYFSL